MKRWLLLGVACLSACISVATTAPEKYHTAFAASASINDLTVGALETVLTKDDRVARGLSAWPDGTMGVLKSGTQYTFFTANSSAVAKTVGTLNNPAETSSAPGIQIRDMKNSYQYTAGGPVYDDPNSATLLMFYHAEKWIGGIASNFWSAIGMAKSTDGGNSWTDLGEIITPNVPDTMGHEITGGTYAIVGDYFYVYFRDRLASNGNSINLAVARARISDVLLAAASNGVTIWNKYRNGGWSEPGLGGLSSALESGNPGSNYMSVSYNSFAGKYFLVVVGSTQGNWDLYITESADGINWSHRVQLESDEGESYAPSIVGLGEEPRDSDQQFYVYYAYSFPKCCFERWDVAVLARRLITVNGAGNTTPPTAPAAVTNLAAGSASAATLALSWTAPGDDGNVGTATAYDMRYSTARITESNWDSATQLSGEPAPLPAGTPQGFTASGLQCGSVYFFALKTADEVNNVSAISNSPSGKTLPCPVLSVTPLRLPDGEVNHPYDASFNIGGGVGPYTVNLAGGSLPPGLQLGSPRVHGIPKAATTARFTIAVTDQNGATTTKSVSVRILNAINIATSSLRNGQVGRSYMGALRVTGGKAPYTWSILSGAPPWLSINPSTGRLSGVATAPGKFILEIRVQDALGAIASKSLSLTI